MSDNTYWNNNGKYQEEYEALKDLIPSEGRADKLHIDLLRNAVNLYYDYHNNSSCNWDNLAIQFHHLMYYEDVLSDYAWIDGRYHIDQSLTEIEDCAAGRRWHRPPNEAYERLLDVVILYATREETVNRHIGKETE